MKRYGYVSAMTARQNMDTDCAVCGGDGSSGYAYHDGLEHLIVAVCRQCRKEAEEETFLRNEEYIVYKIESGWDSNPVWRCPVSYDGPGEVTHLHTNYSLGEAPGVFRGEVSGLQFEARGARWPIESRKGMLVHVVWVDDSHTDCPVTPERAVEILAGAK